MLSCPSLSVDFFSFSFPLLVVLVGAFFSLSQWASFFCSSFHSLEASAWKIVRLSGVFMTAVVINGRDEEVKRQESVKI